jgi:hypothetical protein
MLLPFSSEGFLPHNLKTDLYKTIIVSGWHGSRTHGKQTALISEQGIFGTKDEGATVWRELHNEYFRNLYSHNLRFISMQNEGERDTWGM